jgi:hypothetical protein
MSGGSVKVRTYLLRLLVPGLVLGTFGALGGTGIASAAQASHKGWWVCSGTLKKPGVLTGHHVDVAVVGACDVNAGHAQVQGNIILAPGATLVAAFARNDRRHMGTSGLTVGGNITVLQGGSLILGCESPFFPCFDDPHPKRPSLSSTTLVGGNLVAADALGILMHHSIIGGNVVQTAGGGGRTCVPHGVFALFKSPVYSDYEDNQIGGGLNVSGLRSCWLGALRNAVHGNLTAAGNKMADPDANEILTNLVHGNIACSGNSPAVQYGDSHGMPNRVVGSAAGECGFGVLQPDPAPSGPVAPISVLVP